MDIMTTTPADPMRLIRSRLHVDGSHTTSSLSQAVRRGEMLRLRRSVYVPASQWFQAYPWDRHLMAAAAHALWRPDSVFCRETALALHGLPLLRTPRVVHVRTARRQQVGRRRPAPMTGTASDAVVREMLSRERGPEGQRLTAHDLNGVSTRRVLTPEPSLDVEVLGGPPGLGQVLRVELLEAAVMDTLPRLRFDEAVVVLDALRAGRHRRPTELSQDSLGQWEHLLTSRMATQRWTLAWEVSDPAAESPGESLSRARMVEAGLLLPELQKVFDLPDGSRARVDFWWPELGLVGEFDGKMKYTRARELSGVDVAQAVFEEKVREDQLRALGLGVVRWCWPEASHPTSLGRLLREVGVPEG
ncbi:hypothetical protein BCY76_007710 [Nesterenkonia sp. PF2B19]|nr:hypothetical protein BCY76_007710 [Nesterenkonia sp. PF2B19]